MAATRPVSAGEIMSVPGFFERLISGDWPRSRILATLLVITFLALAFAPFLFPGTRALGVASRICIFILLAASYDIVLGYTGIVSFAHAMYFGFGAYGVAIMLAKFGTAWTSVFLGLGGAILLSAVVALVIGLISLRVQALFFAMVTLAVASFALILATQMRDLTGGEDGLTFALPTILTPGFKFLDAPLFGVRADGRLLTYYLVFTVSVLLFLVMLRIVNSPFGRVLQAIRENEFRAEALGYSLVVHRTLAGVFGASIAAIAGGLLALVLRYNGPAASMSFEIMVDSILLMAVIGGMGTLYGPALGAVVIVLAQYYLQPGMEMLSSALAAVPLLPTLFHPDRWLLWLGVLFVVIVYFFPSGIVGRLRESAEKKSGGP
jgi:branched-chain amino acid transport system permease protein